MRACVCVCVCGFPEHLHELNPGSFALASHMRAVIKIIDEYASNVLLLKQFLLSLSTVVLNSRDRQGNVWLP